MPDQEQLDRMERKINRIGRSVWLGIVLIAVLIANEIRALPDSIAQGYAWEAAAVFIAVVLLLMMIARTPFRD